MNSLVEAHCCRSTTARSGTSILRWPRCTYWPSDLGEDDLGKATSTNELYEMLTDEALGWYEKREIEFDA